MQAGDPASVLETQAVGSADTLAGRLHSVSRERVIILPPQYGRDEAGNAAATVMQLSATSPDDILILIPPTGNTAAALMLSDVLRLPGVAPTIGVLFGETRTSSPALLQGCSVRVLSEHAQLSPAVPDQEYSSFCYIEAGPEHQTADHLEALGRRLAETDQQCRQLTALIAERTAGMESVVLSLLESEPCILASDAVENGWADALLPDPMIAQFAALEVTGAVLREFVTRRCAYVPHPLDDDGVQHVADRLLKLARTDEAPMVLVIGGPVRRMSTALWLGDVIAALAVPIIGIAASDLDLAGAALLQKCSFRLASPLAKLHLAIPSEWQRVTVTLGYTLSHDEARRKFSELAGQAQQRIARVADVLGRRSGSSADAWLDRMKEGQVLSPGEAVSRQLVDGLLP